MYIKKINQEVGYIHFLTHTLIALSKTLCHGVTSLLPLHKIFILHRCSGQLFDLYEDLRNGTPLEQAIDNKNYFGVTTLGSLMIAREGCDYEDLIQNNISKSVAFEL